LFQPATIQRIHPSPSPGRKDQWGVLGQGPDSFPFFVSEVFFPFGLEDSRDGHSGPSFDPSIQVLELDPQSPGQLPTHSGFPGPHETYQHDVLGDERVFQINNFSDV
jgi:hypothetical protein